nr:CDP-archaeol synthase [Clostridium acetobutylicum]
MYITLFPVILAGIFNMIFVKLPVLNVLKYPIDNNKTLKDGKRIFGDNKTWKGFLGMVVFAAISTVIWGVICSLNKAIYQNNLSYSYHKNIFTFNIILGLALGLAYALCELPNSFFKRRVGIEPGKSINKKNGYVFIIIDQVDSLFGCAFVISLVSSMTLPYYLICVFLGGVTHYILNVLLYLLKLKKNI